MEAIYELKDYVKNTYTDLANSEYRVAVATTIFDEYGNVLLLTRGPKSRSDHGKLEGIGGAVDPGEFNLIKTLKREVSEELGSDLRFEIVDILEIKRDKASDGGTDWIIVNYRSRYIGGEPIIQEGEEEKISEVKFYPLNELMRSKYEMLTENQKYTLRQFRK